MNIADTLNAALAKHQAGEISDAQALYRQVLGNQPNHPDALHMLGVIGYQSGRNEEAVELIGKAIALNPNLAESHRNLGLALVNLRRWDEAALEFSRALELRPQYPKALFDLAGVLREQGKLDAAAAACRRAIAADPTYAQAHNGLGAMLATKGDFTAAAAAYRQAIAHRPLYPQAYFNLGIAMQQSNKLDEAVIAYTRAVELKPDYTEALTNLGVVHKLSGRLDEAIKYYQQAIDLNPANTTAHSNLIYLLEFHPDYTAEMTARSQQAYAQRHAAPLGHLIRPHENDRSADRRLKIGYVSPDLRNHVVGTNLLPLLREHDHEKFEIFCYASVAQPDSMSQRLRSFCDVWRDIAAMGDQEAADVIRRDRIDILVDLTLHMADNRLLMMARKPAPVQVSYLGYCGSTGLSTIDYRISDPHMDPPHEECRFYSEQTVRLPHSYWCYQRPDPAPRIQPPPVLKNGYITFGCLNNFSKVSPAALATWAQVLAEVPRSRMLIHCLPGVQQEAARRQFGAAADRVAFVGKQILQQYLLSYHQIDIALDPFPYGGGITTCDGLWMGVPIVTLSGQRAVGRGGRSILANIGLQQWIAYSPQEYVQLAAELAGDVQRLKDLRVNLREQMFNSPLMDAKGFARDVEDAYRRMWTAWCAK